MNAMTRLVRIAIFLGIVVFLCGILPKLAPTVLPPITVEAEPVLCLGGGDLLHGCAGGFAVTNSLISTLLVDVAVLGLFWVAARKPKLIPSGIQNFFEWMVDLLYNQAQQIAGRNASKIFPIGATIFIFVLFANYMELLPFVDSTGYVRHAEGTTQGYELDKNTPPGSLVVFLNPSCPVITQDQYNSLPAAAQQARATAGCQAPIAEGESSEEQAGWTIVPTMRTATTDINVTLALALAAVAMTQIYGVMGHMPHDKKGIVAVLIGIKRYLSKFFNIGGLRKDGAAKIFGAVDLFASLLEGLSEVVKIISFTFRLFGNIFAGTILIFVVTSLIPYVGPVAALLLEVFVGVIQAYVFMMLTFVFMNTAAQVHGEGAH
jgi:F-type H+-transporting ATPase subunit a